MVLVLRVLDFEVFVFGSLKNVGDVFEKIGNEFWNVVVKVCVMRSIVVRVVEIIFV